MPSLVVTGLAFNQVAIFTDKGMPSSLAALLILPVLAAVAVWFAEPPTLPEPAVSTRGLVADPAD